LEYLAKAWREPDEGIWEVRGGRQHFVHSKVMAWVAFDRSAAAFAVEGSGDEARRWRAVADEIHAEVCERGFDRELNSFVQAYGSKRLDASLLLMSLVGFLPAFCATSSKILVMGCLRAREPSLRAAFGSSTITFCRGDVWKPVGYSSDFCRDAMTWACLPKNSIRCQAACWVTFRRPTVMLV
jgi:hypothetical protein